MATQNKWKCLSSSYQINHSIAQFNCLLKDLRWNPHNEPGTGLKLFFQLGNATDSCHLNDVTPMKLKLQELLIYLIFIHIWRELDIKSSLFLLYGRSLFNQKSHSTPYCSTLSRPSLKAQTWWKIPRLDQNTSLLYYILIKYHIFLIPSKFGNSIQNTISILVL